MKAKSRRHIAAVDAVHGGADTVRAHCLAWGGASAYDTGSALWGNSLVSRLQGPSSAESGNPLRTSEVCVKELALPAANNPCPC